MSVPSTGLSKLKKKHIRVKHQKVKLFRANEPLLSVFMWGVNHTINELSHVSIPVMLLPDDFRAYSKLKVDNHLFNKENMPSHFKVKEYCPLVFRNLRERFGIDDIDYKESLTRFRKPDNYLCSRAAKRLISKLRRSATAPSGVADLKQESHQEGLFHDASAFVKRGLTIKRLRSQPIPDDSSGKSGAKFYQSYDRLFILKTLTSEEVERMHSFLKHYHPEMFDVSFRLMHLLQAGIITFLEHKDLPATKICPLDLQSKDRQLRNSDLMMTYMIMAIGLASAVAVFVGEMCMKRSMCFNLDSCKETKCFTRSNKIKSKDYDDSHPPAYDSLFGTNARYKINDQSKRKIINGTEYWVVNTASGDIRLIPVRTPSAFLYR